MNHKYRLLTTLTLLLITLTITPAQADPWDSPAYIYQITATPPTPSPAGTTVTLTAQTDQDTYLDQETSSGTYQVGFPGGYYGQTFVPQETNVKEVLLWIKPQFTTNTQVNVTIWDGPREDPESNQLGFTTQNTTAGFYKIYTYRFPEAIPVTPGETYFIYADGEVWIKGHYFHDSSTADHYPPGGITPKPGDYHGDYWFKTYAQKDLEYGFSLDGMETWTPWSPSDTYQWDTTMDDTGNHSIHARVKDNTMGGTIIETWWAITYTVTPPTIDTVITLIEQSIPHQGTANSLISQLRNAQQALERGNQHTADNIINAYINHLEAQAGKHVPAELAETLINIAQHW